MSSRTATSSSSGSTSERAGLARALTRWFASHARDLPWRRTRDPYAILVSEFMLQQTTARAVIPYFERWMRELPSFEALAAASEERVLGLWEGLGYYSRASNLRRLAQAVVSEHNGALPRDPAALGRLPGVGPYTRGAVASFAFNLPEPAVDANIARVLARLFNVTERCDTPGGRRRLENLARGLLESLPGEAGAVNAALMELGALICRSGEPVCLLCPVREYCRAENPAALPVKRPRAAAEEAADCRAWVVSEGRVLLEKSEGPRWRGLWLLPPCEPPRSRDRPPSAPVYEAVYAITKYRVTLRVWKSRAPGGNAGEDRRIWAAHEDLRRLPMPAPHRKAARALLSAEAGKTAGE